MKLQIFVAMHKPYWQPEHPVYVPLHVGKAGKEGFGIQGDNEGDSISEKNKSFCELTGIYWAWKNTQSDAVGLVHYRRYFRMKRCGFFGEKDPRACIADGAYYERLLSAHDVLLPYPRNYYIETTYSQYAHAHHIADLDETRRILSERCPEMLDSFDRVMKQTKGHRFNMFVMKRDIFDRYCAWLFPILFELERRIDISGYDAYNARVFGFIGERLLDVWLMANGIQYLEIPIIALEKENWFKKGTAFLLRKLRGGTNGQRRT